MKWIVGGINGWSLKKIWRINWMVKKMEKEYMKGVVIFLECFCDIRLVGFYLDRGI